MLIPCLVFPRSFDVEVVAFSKRRNLGSNTLRLVGRVFSSGLHNLANTTLCSHNLFDQDLKHDLVLQMPMSKLISYFLA